MNLDRMPADTKQDRHLAHGNEAKTLNDFDFRDGEDERGFTDLDTGKATTHKN